jgi:hypothetical protein
MLNFPRLIDRAAPRRKPVPGHELPIPKADHKACARSLPRTLVTATAFTGCIGGKRASILAYDRIAVAMSNDQ